MGLESVGFPTEHQYFYNVLDVNGELLSQVSFFDDSTNSTTTRGSAFVADWMSQEELIIAGSFMYNSGVDQLGSLVKYNILTQEFDIIGLYNIDLQNQFNTVNLVGAEDLIVSGIYLNPSLDQALGVYKINIANGIVWEFNNSCGDFCSATPHQVINSSNNEIYVLAQEYDTNQPAFSQRLSTMLIKLDEQGQELWRVYPGDPENFWIDPGGIIETDNGILVFYSNPKFYQANNQHSSNLESEIQFSQYDHNGNLLWSDHLDNDVLEVYSEQENSLFHHFTKAMQTSDGSYVLSGQMGYRAFLLKLDSNFEIDWYRLYTPHTFLENPNTPQFTVLYNFIPTLDGGYMMAGQYDSAPGDIYPQGIQTAIALKVDEFGCLEPGCQLNDPIGIEEIQGLGVKLFPNPAKEELTLQFNPSFNSNEIEDILIYDIQGKSVLNKSFHSNRIDISSLHAGLYLLELRTKNGERMSARFVKE